MRPKFKVGKWYRVVSKWCSFCKDNQCGLIALKQDSLILLFKMEIKHYEPGEAHQCNVYFLYGDQIIWNGCDTLEHIERRYENELEEICS